MAQENWEIPNPDDGHWDDTTYHSVLLPCNELTREDEYGDPCSCVDDTCCTYFDDTYTGWKKDQYRCKDFFAGTPFMYTRAYLEYDDGKDK